MRLHERRFINRAFQAASGSFAFCSAGGCGSFAAKVGVKKKRAIIMLLVAERNRWERITDKGVIVLA